MAGALVAAGSPPAAGAGAVVEVPEAEGGGRARRVPRRVAHWRGCCAYAEATLRVVKTLNAARARDCASCRRLHTLVSGVRARWAASNGTK